MRFAQLHGCQNAYVFVDVRGAPVADPAALAVRAADPATGPAGGSDGLILVDVSLCADVRMHMFNADGSRGVMCGNGIRGLVKLVLDGDPSTGNIVAGGRGESLRLRLAAVEPALASAWAWIDAAVEHPAGDQEWVVRRLTVETDAGVRAAFGFCVGGVTTHATIDMGVASVKLADMPARPRLLGERGERIVEHAIAVGGDATAMTCVTVGNPHVVVFVERAGSIDLGVCGPQVADVVDVPGGVNVHFVEVVHRGRLFMRPWERGSGATMACGTGACAALVAGHVTGRTPVACVVAQPGGEVWVELVSADTDRIPADTDRWRVFMTGPAECVASGEWAID